jgi:hypothetical protein
VDGIDVSNSNTPAEIDPTNPVPSADYRSVGEVDLLGIMRFAETNAYSGNNGRAAILNNSNGANLVYTAGNAGNGSNPQPDGIIIGTSAQILTPTAKPEVVQTVGAPTPISELQHHATWGMRPTSSERTPTSAA